VKKIEISEDGAPFVVAYDGTAFQAPYTGRVRRADGQRIWIYIEKTSLWPIQAEILIKFTGTDDFDQDVSKTLPVETWD